MIIDVTLRHYSTTGSRNPLYPFACAPTCPLPCRFRAGVGSRRSFDTDGGRDRGGALHDRDSGAASVGRMGSVPIAGGPFAIRISAVPVDHPLTARNRRRCWISFTSERRRRVRCELHRDTEPGYGEGSKLLRLVEGRSDASARGGCRPLATRPRVTTKACPRERAVSCERGSVRESDVLW